MKLKLTTFIPHKPTPKQAAFLMFDGLEALYGGAAGGGKSDALLMGALQYVDQPKYSAIIFRRSYTDLALPGAIMDRAHEWLKPFKDIRWDRETHTFEFPSGASLTFGYIQTPGDRLRYQSAEFQYVAWDEVTEFPDDLGYTFLFSRLRKLKGSDIPLRVRCASNPVGPGTTWVRKRFFENAPPPIDSKRIFVPATFHENPHIDAETYLRSLQQLPQATQERLIDGSWESIDSAAFPHFDPEVHVLKPEHSFIPPWDWRRWEAMDFGVSNPTAWYPAAMDPEGYVLVFGEYYSPGLISDHASRVHTLRANRWGSPSFALCDPSITARTGFGDGGGRGDTIHSEFSKHGIFLVSANNDRRAGLVRISELLRPDPSRVFPDWHHVSKSSDEYVYGSPGVFFCNCPELVEQLRFAPLDEAKGDIVDPFWETRHGHAMAAARYLLTARVLADKREVSAGPRVGRTLGEWTPQTEWREWQ